MADRSNVVSLLFGNTEPPALVVSCADDWTILPAGVAPGNAGILPASMRPGIVTQALHIVLWERGHPAWGRGHLAWERGHPARIAQGRSLVQSRDATGAWRARPDLTLTAFDWHDPEQAIPNWTQVGVSLAGPQAALLALRMRWGRDATVIIFK